MTGYMEICIGQKLPTDTMDEQMGQQLLKQQNSGVRIALAENMARIKEIELPDTEGLRSKLIVNEKDKLEPKCQVQKNYLLEKMGQVWRVDKDRNRMNSSTFSPSRMYKTRREKLPFYDTQQNKDLVKQQHELINNISFGKLDL